MAIDSTRLNIFSQSSALGSIGTTQNIGSSKSFGGSSSMGNLPAQKTAGINDNLKVGDSVYTAAQAGKAPGVSRILGIG